MEDPENKPQPPFVGECAIGKDRAGEPRGVTIVSFTPATGDVTARDLVTGELHVCDRSSFLAASEEEATAAANEFHADRLVKANAEAPKNVVPISSEETAPTV